MKDRLVVALDVDNRQRALELVDLLRDVVGVFKIGSQLFTSEGPGLVREIREAGGRVFLDLKFHDIPNTVAGAAKAAGKLGIFMLDVHATGGAQMLEAAVEASREGADSAGVEPPHLLGITVLTSLGGDQLKRELQVGMPVGEYVPHLAGLCEAAGLAGVVASPQELPAIRKVCGRNFLIITPGIRLKGAKHQDQVRITTPGDAIQMGADYIVVGRPIVAAPDPAEAANEIVEQMQKG